MDIQLSSLVLVMGWITVVFVGALEIAILWLIFKGKIDLKSLISDEDGDASLSRFQFLLFTFVIVMGLFLIIVNKADFPEIPVGILGILGISGGSYVISKGIQLGAKSGQQKPPAQETK